MIPLQIFATLIPLYGTKELVTFCNIFTWALHFSMQHLTYIIYGIKSIHYLFVVCFQKFVDYVETMKKDINKESKWLSSSRRLVYVTWGFSRKVVLFLFRICPFWQLGRLVWIQCNSSLGRKLGPGKLRGFQVIIYHVKPSLPRVTFKLFSIDLDEEAILNQQISITVDKLTIIFSRNFLTVVLRYADNWCSCFYVYPF